MMVVICNYWPGLLFVVEEYQSRILRNQYAFIDGAFVSHHIVSYALCSLKSCLSVFYDGAQGCRLLAFIEVALCKQYAKSKRRDLSHPMETLKRIAIITFY